MYLGFIEKLSEGLLEREFSIVYTSSPAGRIEEETKLVVYLKIESPVLYVLAAVRDGASDPNIMQTIDNFLHNVERDLNRYHCNRIICVCLFAQEDENSALRNIIEERQILMDSELLTVWWLLDLSSGSVFTGRHQPSRILDLRQLIETALARRKETAPFSVEDIVKRQEKKAMKDVKSYGAQATGCLIAIFMAIWIGSTLLGRENEMLQRFSLLRKAVVQGEYYRLVTPIFLHLDWEHVTLNCFSLYLFGRKAEEYYGKIGMLTLFFLSGIAGNLASIPFLYGASAGASGAVYGLMGAVLVLSGIKKKSFYGLPYASILLMIVAGFGFGALLPDVNSYAHAGGLFMGCLIGFVMLKIQNRKEKNISK